MADESSSAAAAASAAAEQAEEQVGAVASTAAASGDTVVAGDDKKEDADAVDVVEEAPAPAVEAAKGGGGDEKVPESGSFKEESSRVADLADNEKKALQELKSLIRQALTNHEFKKPDPEPAKPSEPVKPPQQEEKGPEKEEEKGPEKEEEAAVQEQVKETEVVVEQEKTETTTTTTTTTTVEAPPTVDDDGIKTVEAIEETVVAVSEESAPKAEEEPKAEQEKKQEHEQPPPKAEEEPKPEEEKEEQEQAPPKAEEEPKPEQQEEKQQEQPPPPPQEVSIWGVPLLVDDRTDVILLKFLRARDFKVKESFAMIKNTILWRQDFRIDELVQEDLAAEDLEKAVYMEGLDKEGHPVCYNVYGEFQDKELYKKAFSDEEKRQRFLRWRIQFLERSIRKLDFSPGGISTFVQVNDLKNSPGPGKWELRQATKQALQLLQDNYPEFVAKQVFINVPWWYLAVNRMISPFLTQRTKSKFVFAGPSKSAETLLRYIAPEQLPVKYGGLSKDGEFGDTDAVTEITVRPAAKHTVEFPATENCLLSWELRVIGWDVSYGAEFVPSSEGSYTVIIQKERKIASSEEPILSNSYKIGEPGKVVITIDNQSSKKKKLLYRLKTKPSSTTD